ncbi:unnamed protein product [Trichobilharzia szidati]|nr:unnamed protein product [Trichobilharzia szidati]
MNLIAVFIVLLAASGIVKCEFTCRIPKPIPLQYTVGGQPGNTEKRSTKPSRLKFSVSYTYGFNRLQEAQKLRKLVEDATKFWQKALTVKNPGDDKQLVKRYCDGEYYYTVSGNNSLYCVDSKCNRKAMCGSLEVPDQYAAECYEQHNNLLYRLYNNGSGIPGNGYVLIVDADESDLCVGSTAAFAASCHMDPRTDRPNVGYMNLCPSQMDLTYPSGKALPGIMIHEIGHALGFTSSSFPFMRDSYGSPRTPRDGHNKPIYRDKYGDYIPSNSTIKNIRRRWISAAGNYTKTIGSFVTPKILDAARRYFNCRTLDGVDLEHYNIIGSVGSHWATKILGTEVMAPRIMIDYAVSEITLAFFEDSGWYIVNYKAAMNMQYGKNLGCDFATKSCYEYADIQKKRRQKFIPFCDNNRQATCRDAYSYGICSIRIYTDGVPAEDQFFKTPPYASTYGARQFGGDDPHRDFCPTQTYECSPKKKLKVFFKGAKVTCPPKGGSIQFNVTDGSTRLAGSIVCPNVNEFCKECYQASPYGMLSQIYQNGTGVPPNSYVLFVTYTQDNLCSGNLYAYATSCQNDPLTDRPVMGYLNMCPDMFSKRVVNPSEWVNIIKHEVGHALSAARKHFNCQTLDGVDLENEGSLASAGSHFEARIYGVSLKSLKFYLLGTECN